MDVLIGISLQVAYPREYYLNLNTYLTTRVFNDPATTIKTAMPSWKGVHILRETYLKQLFPKNKF